MMTLLQCGWRGWAVGPNRFGMRRRAFKPLLIFVFSLGLFPASQLARAGQNAAQSASKPVKPAQRMAADRELKARLAVRSGHLPLSFEANQGQADPRVKFLSRGPGYTLFLTGSQAVLALRKSSAALTMSLAGANPNTTATGLDELSGKSNYFLGADPGKWRGNVPNYAQVRYQNVYPGIDLVYYGNQGRLEYDFVVSPGADPAIIALDLGGMQPARVDHSTGDLVVGAEGQGIRFHKPVIYQQSPGSGRSNIAGGYRISGPAHVTFDIATYDRTKPLVIDPALSYSTYFGGSLDDTGRALAVDAGGNVYLVGGTCSANLPVLGGFQSVYGGDSGNCSITNGGDAFVAKFDSSLSTLLYSTYLGGTGDDIGNGIALDASGDAYVTGGTCSGTTFPITAGAYQTHYGGGSNPCNEEMGDGFVTELNPSGSALIYSTFLGGNQQDTGNAISLDSSNNAYIVGTTCSANFPVTSGAFQKTFGGDGDQCGGPPEGDAFITKLNSTGTALIYSTYLGGSGRDTAYGMALDSSGDVYVTGATYSNNFPTTPGAYSTKCKGCFKSLAEGFVTKLNPSGSALIYSTYLGGRSGTEPCAACATGIAIDSSGDAYVSGLTSDSADFPRANAIQSVYGGGPHDAFLTKFNPSGSALVYSTFLGGNNDDGGTAVVVDEAGDAYIRGNTKSPNYPVTSGAFQSVCEACTDSDYDFFLSEVSPSGTGLLYSTFLGGSLSSFGQATRNLILSSGQVPAIYVTGYSDSTDFPVSIDAYQQTLAGGYDAVIAEFTPGSNVNVNPTSLNFGDQKVGTASGAKTVTVSNGGHVALTIESITITGADAGDFSQTNTCGSSVPALGNCTISVTFKPAATGQRSAGLSISDNGGDSPQQVPLDGTGTQ